MKSRAPTLEIGSGTAVFWRISIHEALDGVGAFRAGGRWNTRGHSVVYLAESPAGAMLEILAHLPLDELDMPEYYRLLRIEALGDPAIANLDPPRSEAWKTSLAITQKLGDAWLERSDTSIARVPSVIMPQTWNYLLNPLHSGAANVRIIAATDHLYDPRLLRVRTP